MNNCCLLFPNEEVERGFLQALAPVYATRENTVSDAPITRIARGIRTGDPEDSRPRALAFCRIVK